MEGEEMIKYRFTKKEVDEMSFNILKSAIYRV